MNLKKTKELPYNMFAQFYDDSMSSIIFNTYTSIIGSVKKQRILDLGCGTGTLLKNYSLNNDTYGVDESSEMIKIAKKKDKKTNYFIGDIKNFTIDEKFHIITCAYDTINHLSGIRNWKKLFKNASDHLFDDGIFIFDFNTLQFFKNYNNKTVFKKIKDNFLIIQTKTDKGVCYWNINLFIKKPKNLFNHQKFTIKEYSYPNKLIIKELGNYFSIIKIIKEKNHRLFIKAKKRCFDN